MKTVKEKKLIIYSVNKKTKQTQYYSSSRGWTSFAFATQYKNEQSVMAVSKYSINFQTKVLTRMLNKKYEVIITPVDLKSEQI